MIVCLARAHSLRLTLTSLCGCYFLLGTCNKKRALEAASDPQIQELLRPVTEVDNGSESESDEGFGYTWEPDHEL